MNVTKKRDPGTPAEQQGVFHKFDVRRVDGSDQPGGKHHGCRYFVLDLDHDPHAAAAMAAYAQDCKATHPTLSAELSAEYPLAEPVAWRYRFRNASGCGSWVVHHGPDKPVNVAFDAMEARPLYAGSLIIEEKTKPLTPGD